MQETREGFLLSMDDDFNSAGALGQMFGLVRVINQARADGATDAELSPAQDLLRELGGVLGLRFDAGKSDSHAADAFIELLLQLRKELRSQKQYEMADSIRKRLSELGVIIEDSKEGSSWRWA